MGRVRAAVWLISGLSFACGPVPPPPAESIPVVAEPSAPLTAVPPVVRFRVTGFGAGAAALSLFSGELGSYYLGRIRAGDLPSTLAVRRVASVAFTSEDGADAVLAPSVPLDPGGTYSVAALGGPRLAEVSVVASSASYATRTWPPKAALGGQRVVFCAAAPVSVGAREFSLSPGDVTAAVHVGADSTGALGDRCFFSDLPDGERGTALVPPPELDGVQLDPSPIARATVAPASRLECAPDELAAGVGCVAVDDDRALLRGPDGPLFWVLRVNEEAPQIYRTDGAHRDVLRGLAPDTPVTLSGTVTDLSGTETAVQVSTRTHPSRPHVILSEVLANPAGPEPAQEWVELLNDGGTPADLGGLSLSDGVGPSPLPSVTLSPGEYALVVGADYDPLSASDVAPASGTLLVRVQRVGASGLSNGGEALSLVNAANVVLSRFPRFAATRPGVSIARRDASVLDDDPHGFGASAAPGASPGWDNHIDAPF